MALSSLVVPRAALAFVAPELAAEKATAVPVGIRVLRPRLVATKAVPEGLKGTTAVRLQVDAASGAARVIEGGVLAAGPALEAQAGARDYEAEARLVVASHPEIFGVDDADLVLDDRATLIDADVQLLKFRVLRDGLLVQDATIDVRFNRGRLVQVVNQAFAEARADVRAPRQGLERAARAAVLGDTATPAGETLRVVETKSGYELVRVAAFDVETATDRFVVQVEAATGKVFEIRPTTFRLDGSASGHLYQRYYAEPLVTLPYGDLSLSYAGGTVTTGLDGDFRGAPDAAQPMVDGFVGPRVKIVLRSGTKVTVPGARVRDRWNVVYQRSGSDPADNDKNVAQSMVFFHTNAMIQRAKAYVSSPWFDRQLTANVNLTQTCNAHWDGSTINFYAGGGGCANTGLISDVVFHEWGHGLDHNSGGIEDGAFSEGFGDIMSMIMTHSNVLGIGFRLDGRPVRDLEPDRIYPQDTGGGVHSEGLIIGSTFWDLFKLLRDQHGEQGAEDLASKYALKVIFTASRYTDVYNALLVIDDDNGDLGDKTPNYCSINKAFSAHGLATADEACNLAAVDGIEVDDRAGGNGNGILEPGESAEIWLTARNAAGGELSGLTGTLRLAGAEGATVTDADLAWDAIPARSQRRSSDPAAVALDATVACGTTLTASVALQAGDRRANVTGDLLVGRLVGTAGVGVTSGLPAPIRDNSSTTATITVDSAQWGVDTKVHAARLKFDVTHTYQGDLSVRLVSPDGTSKDVFRGSGATDDIHFDADVTALLSGLKGKGAWQLVVTDSASQDVGTFDAAELTLTPAAFACD